MLFELLIHVASFGADQLSFGTTLPPSSSIVDFTDAWMSGHSVEGSSGSESEEAAASWSSSLLEKIPLSESDQRVLWGTSSGGSKMPSAWR
jgi:hypothetical protein